MQGLDVDNPVSHAIFFNDSRNFSSDVDEVERRVRGKFDDVVGDFHIHALYSSTSFKRYLTLEMREVASSILISAARE